MRRLLQMMLAAALVLLAGMAGVIGSASARGRDTRPAQATPFPTPTPNAEGQIFYEVQLGDTCWRISAVAGISMQELMALNGMKTEDCDFLPVGARLLLGTGQRPVPTIPTDAFPAATEIPATPTPMYGTGEVCVLLFVDENGNGRLDEGEGPLVGGQVSIVEVSGTVAVDFTTDENIEVSDFGDLLGHCFADVAQGDYNISVAVPSDYNPTTAMSIPLRLEPGDTSYIEFGAQPSASLAGGLDGGGDTRSALLGLLGIFLLLGAGVLGYMASRLLRRSPRSLR
jgi:hypothetical protein